ncbi:hypothetical protein MJO28_012931 [Puccinia striiformis f. sp. tritici]|uniref:Uncharacterized protein n=1 Tax=Puccinia striiformis f. sp. tritici TaxID=168172 RepID=A0ACC0DX42_9BASI|nr:hypothetical protein MJO28_012931 [Puccinia striiformis f. sp. tritici]
MDANELIGIEKSDEAQYQKIVAEATAQTYTFVCHTKEETHKDVNRTKHSVIHYHIAAVNWVCAGLQMAESFLKNYSA